MKDKGMLAWVAFATLTVVLFCGIISWTEISKVSFDVKRGDIIHFRWTEDNKFYSSNCTDYGTAIDQVGEKVYKVMILCAPVKGSQSFVSLIIHWYDIVKVDQDFILTKPISLDSEE